MIAILNMAIFLCPFLEKGRGRADQGRDYQTFGGLNNAEIRIGCRNIHNNC